MSSKLARSESLSDVMASAGVACFQFLEDAPKEAVAAGRRIYGDRRDEWMQEYYEGYMKWQNASKTGTENVAKADNALVRSQKTLETRRKEAARLMESYALKEKKSKACTDEKVAEKVARELKTLHKELQNSEAKRHEMDRQVLREEAAAAEARSRLKAEKDEMKVKEEQLRNHVNLVVKDFMVGACASYDNSESPHVPITVGTCTDVACFNRALQCSKVLPGKSTDAILVQATGEDKEKVSGFLYQRSMLTEGEPDEKDQEALQSLLAELNKHAGWNDAWRTVEHREKQLAQRRAAEAEKKRLAALNTPSARMKRTYVDLQRKSIETKDNALLILRDPQFQTCTIATAGGAITFGAAGGTFGLASGVVVGSAVGVVPALFTFGLSIPVGAAIGGGCGLCTGTLVGGTSGGVGGFSIYKYRIQIKDGVMTVKVRVEDMVQKANTKAAKALADANQELTGRVCKFRANISALATKGRVQSLDAIEHVKTKASDAYAFATTTKVGVTSTSAAAGAVVGGTGGGACGTVVGAAVGIVPAIFTFGLSIPIGAAIGCFAGTTVGGSAGAIGGGLAGYTGFTHGKAIKDCAKSSWSNASTRADNLKYKTIAKASQAGESVKSMVRRGHTGSTE